MRERGDANRREGQRPVVIQQGQAQGASTSRSSSSTSTWRRHSAGIADAATPGHRDQAQLSETLELVFNATAGAQGPPRGWFAQGAVELDIHPFRSSILKPVEIDAQINGGGLIIPKRPRPRLQDRHVREPSRPQVHLLNASSHASREQILSVGTSRTSERKGGRVPPGAAATRRRRDPQAAPQLLGDCVVREARPPGRSAMTSRE